MGERRKVYIASQMTQEEIDKEFKFLFDLSSGRYVQYERAIDPLDAEIIIYDLCNKVEDWPRFLGAPVHKAPVIFAALGDVDSDNWEIIKKCFPYEPDLSTNQQGLHNKLAQTIFIIRQVEDTEISKRIRSLTLAMEKNVA